jgi:hypothetical protein
VATPVLDEFQGDVRAGDALPVNCVVAFTHIFRFPEIVGSGFTVIVTVLEFAGGQTPLVKTAW